MTLLEAIMHVKFKFCFCPDANEQQRAMRFTPQCNVDLALDYLQELLKRAKKKK